MRAGHAVNGLMIAFTTAAKLFFIAALVLPLSSFTALFANSIVKSQEQRHDLAGREFCMTEFQRRRGSFQQHI